MNAKTKPPLKPNPATALHLQPLLDDLEGLRQTLREVISGIAGRLEGDIAHVHAAISAGLEARRLPVGRGGEIRDMLMLIRGLDVKPAKGRRRDLKKIEAVTDELRRLTDSWEE